MQYIIEVTVNGKTLWVQDWGIDCPTCKVICPEKWAAFRFSTKQEAQELAGELPEQMEPVTIHEVNFVGDFEVEPEG